MADNRKLTEGDKSLLKLVESGMRPSPAFRKSYPDHPAVIAWNRSEPGSPDHQKAAEAIKQAAKNKLAAKYMSKALETYQDSMDKFSELSVKTAIELVKGARSEKVRADLAIEGMRHKVGAPTQKVAIEEKAVVYLTFDKPPGEEDLENPDIIDVEPITDTLDDAEASE